MSSVSMYEFNKYQEQRNSLTDIKYAVKRCAEFDSLGMAEFTGLNEALKAFRKLRETDGNSIPSIGLVNKDGSVCDIIAGTNIDLENIGYYFEGKQKDRALFFAKELVDRYISSIDNERELKLLLKDMNIDTVTFEDKKWILRYVDTEIDDKKETLCISDVELEDKLLNYDENLHSDFVNPEAETIDTQIFFYVDHKKLVTLSDNELIDFIREHGNIDFLPKNLENEEVER